MKGSGRERKVRAGGGSSRLRPRKAKSTHFAVDYGDGLRRKPSLSFCSLFHHGFLFVCLGCQASVVYLGNSSVRPLRKNHFLELEPVAHSEKNHSVCSGTAARDRRLRLGVFFRNGESVFEKCLTRCRYQSSGPFLCSGCESPVSKGHW